MERLIAVTVLVAVGSALFFAGFPQGILLMSLGVIALLGGVIIAYHCGLRIAKNEAK